MGLELCNAETAFGGVTLVTVTFEMMDLFSLTSGVVTLNPSSLLVINKVTVVVRDVLGNSLVIVPLGVVSFVVVVTFFCDDPVFGVVTDVSVVVTTTDEGVVAFITPVLFSLLQILGRRKRMVT